MEEMTADNTKVYKYSFLVDGEPDYLEVLVPAPLAIPELARLELAERNARETMAQHAGSRSYVLVALTPVPFDAVADYY